MFKHLLKGLLAGMAVTLLDNYRRLSVHLLKIEAARFYLHGVQLARLSTLGLLRIGLVIGLICVGVLIFHTGLFILLPWSVAAKAVLGMVLGLAYVIGGSLALHTAMDEKTWMEKSGADKLLEEAIGQFKKGLT
jgi:hypothetical protein